MRVLLALLLCLCLLVVGEEQKSMDELKRWPLKQLRAFLDERGIVCRGCAEKHDFVQKVFESQSVLPKEVDTAKKILNEKKSDFNIEELLEKMPELKGKFKIFKPEDMKKMMKDAPPPPPGREAEEGAEDEHNDPDEL